MKKTYLACILCAAFSANAFAQSSVTLYGLVDVGYAVGNGGIYEGGAGRDSKFQQWGNARSTSHWGLKGTEDLGNGNKVYFQLEQEFNPENGKDEDGFNNAAYVGISGNWGALQAGRQSTVSSNIMIEFDVSGAPVLTSSLGNAGISGDSQRFGTETFSKADSVLAYISPEFSGFQLQAAVILKNDDAFGFAQDSKNIFTLGALYNYGGLTVGAVFESKPGKIANQKVSSSWGLGAKYDFGTFLISGSYFDNHLKSDGRGFSLGVSIPVNAFEFGAQIAYNTKAYKGTENVYGWGYTGSFGAGYNPWDSNNYAFGVVDTRDKKVKPFAWELYALYNMSKRTQLYAQVGGTNNDAKMYNDATRKYSAGFGLIHSF